MEKDVIKKMKMVNHLNLHFSMENIETLSNYDIFLGSYKILTEKIQNFNSNIQENNLKIDFRN